MTELEFIPPRGFKSYRPKVTTLWAWKLAAVILFFLGALTYFHFEVITPIITPPKASACMTNEECCKGTYINQEEANRLCL